MTGDGYLHPVPRWVLEVARNYLGTVQDGTDLP